MGRAAKPVHERLADKVDRRGPAECWPFMRSLDTKGYGRFMLNPGELGATARTWVTASRVAFLLSNDSTIDDARSVDHECHNVDTSCEGGATCPHRACCNPAHLSGVTQRENVLAGRGGRRDHCPQGHAMTPDNLVQSDLTRGHWRCRTCRNTQKRAAYQRRSKGDVIAE